MEDHGLLDDMKFDAELEGFFSGTGGTVNLQPQPTAFGNYSEETTPLKTGEGASPSGAAAAASGAAAVLGSLAVAQTLLGGSVSGTIEKVAAATVPTSLQPMKEKAGAFLSKAQPWRDFLLPLSVPPASEGCSRITANIYNFQTNYAILFVVQLVLAIVLQPSALITIILTAVVWMLFLKKNDDPDWKPVLGGVELGPMQRWLLMAAVTAIVLLFVAGSAIFNTTLLYLCFVLAHGIIHDPSAKGIPGSVNPPVPV